LLQGLEAASNVPGARVFHAKTFPTPDGPRSAGGRLINVVAEADTIHEAQRTAYTAMGYVQLAGERLHFRRDIGTQALGCAIGEAVGLRG
jgi:phosphoribosylamine-glycine ligase